MKRRLRFWLHASVAAALVSGTANAQAPLPFVLRQLGPGVYAAIDGPEHKAGSNAGFVIGDDGVLVVDAFFTPDAARALVAEIKRLTPKPIRYVVTSHYHNDHVGGVRPYAAEGVTFLTTADAAPRIELVLAGRHVMRPDTFSMRPVNPKIEIVENTRVIEDSTRRLVLYQIGPTAHVDKILIGYLPREKTVIEGDLLDIPDGKPSAGGEDTDQFAADSARLHDR